MWTVTGPVFGFSDTWQLVINTGTTIVTFLMVFVIQNSQNRDTSAMQIKLDELLRAMDGARNSLIDLEDSDEEELAEFRVRYARLAEAARETIEEHSEAEVSAPLQRQVLKDSGRPDSIRGITPA